MITWRDYKGTEVADIPKTRFAFYMWALLIAAMIVAGGN